MKRRMRTISLMVFGSLILLVLLLSACGPGTTALPCSTAVITVTKPADTNDGVCSGSDCSLREAVIMSNTCAGTQTVRIPAGTYPLTIAGTGEDAAAAGDRRYDRIDNPERTQSGRRRHPQPGHPAHPHLHDPE